MKRSIKGSATEKISDWPSAGEKTRSKLNAWRLSREAAEEEAVLAPAPAPAPAGGAEPGSTVTLVLEVAERIDFCHLGGMLD